MKVLLLKDVYKLGHAGDVKKVADGYGRNYLLPQGLAALATPGALKTVEKIREKASVERALLNQEMSGIAELIKDAHLQFFSKAGETGKLYGSITTQMMADELNKKFGTSINRHQLEIEPIRTLGEHTATVRLTVDLNPKIVILVNREGEAAKISAKKAEAAAVKVEESADTVVTVEEAAEELVEEVTDEVVEETPLESAEEAIEETTETTSGEEKE